MVTFPPMNKIFVPLIVCLSTSGYLATDIILPILPIMGKVFSCDDNLIQFSISLYIASLCLAQLFFGFFSDQFGRRNLILAGMLVSTVGTIMCALAKTAEFFIFARCIQAIGLGAPTVLARAILPDLYRGKTLAKYNSYVVIGIPFVLTASPILGSYIEKTFNWQSIYLFMLIYFPILAVVSYYKLPETIKSNATKSSIKDYIDVLCNRKFLGFSLCAACGSGCMIAYITESPFLLQNIGGLSTVEYSYISIILCLLISLTGYMNSKLVNNLHYELLVMFGSGIILISGLLMFNIAKYYEVNVVYNVVFCVSLYIIGNTLVSTNCQTAAVNNLDGNIGKAISVFSTIRLTTGSIISFYIAKITFKNELPLAYCFIILGAFSIFIYSIIKKYDRMKVLED